MIAILYKAPYRNSTNSIIFLGRYSWFFGILFFRGQISLSLRKYFVYKCIVFNTIPFEMYVYEHLSWVWLMGLRCNNMCSFKYYGNFEYILKYFKRYFIQIKTHNHQHRCSCTSCLKVCEVINNKLRHKFTSKNTT